MHFRVSISTAIFLLLNQFDPAEAQSRDILLGAASGAILESNLSETSPITSGKRLQVDLNNAGYSVGQVDGIIGQNTKSAILKFQIENGFLATGTLTAEQRELLRALGNAKRSTLERAEVKELQELLNDMGFPAGTPDGYAGAMTRRAVLQMRSSKGSTQTGAPSKADLALARSSSSRFERQNAVSQVLSGLSTAAAPEAPVASSGSLDAVPMMMVPTFRTAESAQIMEPVPTRAFSSPYTYPPKGFRGYGIVAFKSNASKFDFERHRMFCAAYVSSLPQTKTVSSVADIDQFLTVWPVNSKAKADLLNEFANTGSDNICQVAVEEYSQVAALSAINAAEAAGFKSQGIGPFLLAWSPTSNYGENDSFVLSIDLSSVETYTQAQAFFQDWKDIISEDFSTLQETFSVKRFQLLRRRWADSKGPSMMTMFGRKK